MPITKRKWYKIEPNESQTLTYLTFFNFYPDTNNSLQIVFPTTNYIENIDKFAEKAVSSMIRRKYTGGKSAIEQACVLPEDFGSMNGFVVDKKEKATLQLELARQKEKYATLETEIKISISTMVSTCINTNMGEQYIDYCSNLVNQLKYTLIKRQCVEKVLASIISNDIVHLPYHDVFREVASRIKMNINSTPIQTPATVKQVVGKYHTPYTNLLAHSKVKGCVSTDQWYRILDAFCLSESSPLGLKILFQEIKTEPTPKLSKLETLYPAFENDISKLNSMLQASKERLLSQKSYSLTKDFAQFYHKIKNNLMYLYPNEEAAVKLIHNKVFLNLKETISYKTCAYSSVIIPTFLGFYVNVNKETMDTRFVHIEYAASLPNKFNLSEWPNGCRDNGDSYRTLLANYGVRTPGIFTPKAAHKELVNNLAEDNPVYFPPFLGIELEMSQIMTGYSEKDIERTELIYNLLGRDYIITKSDASIRGWCPTEVVTCPATLTYHKERWAKFLKSEEKQYFQSYLDQGCGMHVHISRNSFNGLHLAKFMRFINCDDNHKFITDIAQRKENGYCSYEKSWRIKECTQGIFGGKRGAVNCNNDATIEVRIFKGNLATTAFYKNIEFVHAVWLYTRDASMRQLNYKDFLFWLFDSRNDTKDYANLKKWLIAAKYTVSNTVIKTDVPKEERLKLLIKNKQGKQIRELITRKYKKVMEDKKSITEISMAI